MFGRKRKPRLYEPVGLTASGTTGAFDVNDLRSSDVASNLAAKVLDDPRWLFGALRRYWPIARIPFTNWAFVSRHADVQDVLRHHDVFQMMTGGKIEELNAGPNFLLGMEDTEAYWRYQKQVMRMFPLTDIAGIVAPLAAGHARRIVSASAGRIDAIQDLITRVPLLLCEDYYGLTIAPEDRNDFANWTMAMSTYMFGDPNDKPEYRRAALAAGEQVRRVVEAAIAAARRGNVRPDTVLQRMVQPARKDGLDLSDDDIRAILIGMVTGFIPTNTMAAGNMLETLLRRPEFMAETRAAALAGDDDLLKRCLFEAMRFRPLNPGPFRMCMQDYTIAAGTSRATTIRKGTKVLASTQSAMFDERAIRDPDGFDPGRPQTDYMLFGHGLHWCIGAFIAEAQITQTFKPLLRQRGLRRAAGKDGQLQRLGPFPEHLTVEFDLPAAG